MPHIRKGDSVVVIGGSNKGKRGKVLRILGSRVVIEKVAMIKRHSKASQKNPQGGIVDKEGSVHISNVQLWDDKKEWTASDGKKHTGGGTRTKTVADGDDKVRVGVKSGTKFPTAGM